MTNPESDFPTWITLASTVIEDITEFIPFTKELIRLIQTIIKTSKLPEEIQEYTDIFYGQIRTEFLKKIFKLEKIPQECMKPIFEFMKSVLDLSNWAIQNNVSEAIPLAEDILSSMQSSFAEHNKYFPIAIELPKYAAQIGIYKSSMKLIQNKPETITILSLLINLCIRVSTFVKDYDFFTFAKISTKSLEAMIQDMNKKKKIRDVQTNSVSNIYLSLKTNACVQPVMDKEFIKLWIDVLKLLIQPEIFEKRLFSLKTFLDLVTTKETSEYSLEIISQDPSFLDGSVMHEEFTTYIASILSQLCKANLVKFDLIKKLFEKHSVQYITELPKFYNIFSTISKTLDDSLLPDFVELIMNPTEKNEPWYDMIGQVALNLGNRQNATDGFNKMREMIYQASEEGDDRCTNIYSTILHFHLNQEEFDQKIAQITSKEINEKTFIVIKTLCSTFTFSDQNKAKELLQTAIKLIQEDKITKLHDVLDCLFNICFMNSLELSKDDITKIYPKYTKDDFVLSFLLEMSKDELVSQENLISVISQDQTEITQDLITFIEKFIKRINNLSQTTLTSLPLVGEDILWNMCTRHNQPAIQIKISNVLCEIYASNDGIKLTDLQMINTFLNRWEKYLKETTEEQIKTQLITLLKQFIEVIENPLDVSYYGVVRHKPETDFIQVEISGATFPQQSLPSSTTISALLERVSKITGMPPNSFTLSSSLGVLDKKKTLMSYQRNKTAKFVLTKSSSIQTVNAAGEIVKSINLEHPRTSLPSIIISTSHISETLTNLLKENVPGSMQLLELLPTLQSTLLEINVLKNVPHYDYTSNLLNANYPSLFLYNLDGILTRLDDQLKDAFKRTGGVQCLIQSIITLHDFKTINKIFNFLSKLYGDDWSDFAQEFGQIALDNCLLALNQSIDNKNEFALIGNYIKQFLDKCKDKLILKEAEKYSKYLLSNEEYIRQQFCAIFTKVDCDQKALTILLKDIPKMMEEETNKEDNTTEDEKTTSENTKQNVNTVDKFTQYFKVLSSHITQRDDDLTNFIISKIKEDINSPNYLEVAKPLLEKGFVPEDKKEDLISYLMDKFLIINDEKRNKQSYSIIAQIISQYKTPKLVERITALHKQKLVFEKPRIDGDTCETKTGYVGLVNLGATCFLNSTLQQFFMIPKIRKAIIEYNGEDEFMQELSKLYAKLLLSNCRSVTTEPLVKKWTNWAGEPMNPREQQDACEFVQMLIDKLEGGLGVEFIQNLFQADTVQIIEGLNEEYHSERIDKQYTTTLQVKDSPNMESSLDKLSTPDYFTDENQYKPDTMDHKIDAKKYNSLNHVPPYLIIQLARFDYNYHTWERIKINSQFDIPLDLDLSGRLKSNQKQTKYKLHGIIMHYGSAQYGHYISYVKERKEGGKWYCFNDQTVTEISEETVLKSGSGALSGRSGYILFYDREDYENITVEEPHISKEIQNAVQLENDLNAQYRLFCSDAYYQLMKSCAESKEKDVFKLALDYAIDSFPYTWKGAVPETCKQFYNSILTNIDVLPPDFSNEIYKDQIYFPLMQCPSKGVRKNIAKIFMKTNGLTNEFYLSLFDRVMENYRLCRQYFRLLGNKINEENKEDTQKFFERSILFLKDEIFHYKEEHKELKDEYFFISLDTTKLFAKLSTMKLTKDFNFMVEDKYLLMLFRSCDREVIPGFLLSLDESANVKEKLISFNERNAIHAPYLPLVQALIQVLGERGFEIAPTVKAKINNKLATSYDLAYLHCTLVSQPKYRDLYMNNIGQWLIDLLTDEDKMETRFAAQHIISYLAPIPPFADLPPLEKRDLIIQDINIQPFIPNPDCKESAQKITDFLLKYATFITTKVNKAFQNLPATITPFFGYIAAQYLETLMKLSDYATLNPQIVDSMIDGFNINPLPFDIHIKMSILLSQKAGILKTSDFFRSLITCTPIKQTGLYLRCIQYMNAILPHIQEESINDQYAESFVEAYAFPVGPLASREYNTISDHINKLSVNHKDAIIHKVDEMGFQKLCDTNYTGVLSVLKAVNIKRPILQQLPHALKTKQFLSQDELVSLAFQFDDGTPFSNAQDYIDFSAITTIPTISYENRKLVWNYMTTNKKPHPQMYYLLYGRSLIPEDYSLYAQYVFSYLSNNYSELLDNSKLTESIINICSHDLNACNESLAFIKFGIENHSNYEWRTLVSDALSLDAQNHVQCVIELTLLATKVAKSEEDIYTLLSPLHNSINRQCRYFIEVINNGGKVPADDIKKLCDYLDIISSHHIMSGPIVSEVGHLVHTLSSQKDEYAELISKAKKCILV